MSALSIVAVVLLSLLLSAVAPHPTLSFDPSRPYPYLVADTFTNIKDSPLERLVLFYFSSSPASAAALSTLNTAARRLHQRLPHFSVQHVDGDLQANREAFISAGFSKPGQWLFTSTPIEGIMKYTGPVTVADIVDHVRHKYLPSSPSDLLRFTTEDAFYDLLDSPTPSPIFLKFYEPWCEHCKRLAPTFAAAATYFRNSSVRFMEVQCSLDAETRGWCDRQGVRSYPVLMLYGGKERGGGGGVGGERGKGLGVRFEEEMRSVAAFDRWFEQEVEGYASVVKEQRKRTKVDKRSSGDREENGERVEKQEVEGRKEKQLKSQVSAGELTQAHSKAMLAQQRAAVNAAAVASPAGAVVVSTSSVEERLTALEGQVKAVLGAVQEIQAAVELLLARGR